MVNPPQLKRGRLLALEHVYKNEYFFSFVYASIPTSETAKVVVGAVIVSAQDPEDHVVLQLFDDDDISSYFMINFVSKHAHEDITIDYLIKLASEPPEATIDLPYKVDFPRLAPAKDAEQLAEHLSESMMSRGHVLEIEEIP